MRLRSHAVSCKVSTWGCEGGVALGLSWQGTPPPGEWGGQQGLSSGAGRLCQECVNRRHSRPVPPHRRVSWTQGSRRVAPCLELSGRHGPRSLSREQLSSCRSPQRVICQAQSGLCEQTSTPALAWMSADRKLVLMFEAAAAASPCRWGVAFLQGRAAFPALFRWRVLFFSLPPLSSGRRRCLLPGTVQTDHTALLTRLRGPCFPSLCPEHSQLPASWRGMLVMNQLVGAVHPPRSVPVWSCSSFVKYLA